MKKDGEGANPDGLVFGDEEEINTKALSAASLRSAATKGVMADEAWLAVY